MLAHLAIGVVLGIVTGIPLGVVNLAVLAAASRGEVRHAVGIGLGGGAADAIHAALAFAGVGALIARDPRAGPALYAVSGVAIAIYGAMIWRRGGGSDSTGGGAGTADDAGNGGARGAAAPSLLRGVAVGAMLTLPNPGALLAWVTVAGAILPGRSIADALTIALGVGIGSMLWFAGLASLARRRAAPIAEPRRRVVLARLFAGALIVLGIVAIGRALQLVI